MVTLPKAGADEISRQLGGARCYPGSIHRDRHDDFDAAIG